MNFAHEAHPDPAEIAELDEDMMPPAGAARLREHLAACPDCAAVRAELAALRRELRELPGPGPMPEDVAARIDAAILAVSRETADAPEKGQRGMAAPAGHPRRYRRATFALAAAAAVAVLGVGGALLGALNGDGGPQPSGLSAGATDEAPAEREAAAQDLSAPAEEALEAQVRQLLAGSTEASTLAAEGPGGTGEPGEGEAPPSSEQQESTAEMPPGPVVVPSCVEQAIGRPEEPLAAGPEDFEGEEAYLVVLPHAADPERVDAYVVAAACVSSSPVPSPGRILVQESYPRD
ncbi:hypothetical protein RM780_08725 [Streptomyces sp. DSM 44917]|uniref:Zinc-finger domain-containing protein n=1 Tax=Streptomyces boetiae TaxID=3075541 RepID=A0ABU2L662_9ACTN|nr:zf-HC2 domain-containing protein [Streptomyces sp. DSM 44917]MDT0307045.1 hypothetical protein [Streptomyces sp. DSM 44917]